VQFVKANVLADVPEIAGAPSKVVEVVAAPLVSINDPAQVPLIEKVFVKPALTRLM
jgi:hypothetical protein